MQKYSEFNDGYTFILFIIDVYSRHLCMIPLRNKRSEHVAQAFSSFINSSKRIPAYINTDMGSEFIGKAFQNMLKRLNIGYFNTFSPNKAAIAERVQRTIKERLFRYFTANNTFRYIDVLDKLAESYNNSFHRSIGMTPNAMLKNKKIVAEYRSEPIKRGPVFSVQDLVRISKIGAFKKGFEKNWSDEVFKISHTKKRGNIYVYYIKDLNNEPIKGVFYKEELQKVYLDMASKKFKIEKILHTRGKGKRKQYYVKWLGYPDTFNSYISGSQIENVKSSRI